MLERLLGKMVSEQLRFLMPRALAADALIWLVTLPFYGLSYEIPLGLALGTVAMIVNFILLGYSVERAVQRPLKLAKRYMFSFYLIRFTCMGAALVWGFNSSLFNPVTVFLPLLFPKVIYTVDAFVKEIKSKKQSFNDRFKKGR